MKDKGQKVYVGLSGGVDSSVSAALLLDQGHDVTGVFIRTWHPDWLPCTWEADRRDAMRVCAHLGIQFRELDLSAEYKRDVADCMIAEYKAGRTPNPDVMCNRHVKFGGFLDWALAQGADYIATGHYAQIKYGEYSIENRGGHMLRGKDKNKDQSYFLWTLTQQDLAHTLFPVGDIPKPKVRKLAKKYGLSTAAKPDSQGVCFLGAIDMKEFLSHYIDVAPGQVLGEGGEVIGHHQGAVFYTLGERHGFTVTKKTTHDLPYYVIARDIVQNTITVSHKKDIDPARTNLVNLKSVNDINGTLKIGQEFTAQIRYRGSLQTGEIIDKIGDGLKIKFAAYDPTLAAGQSVVFYDGEICLGGG